MKTTRQTIRAFTLVELIAVLVTIGLLAAMLLPALARTKASVQRIDCSNNLKQIGLAFHTWAGSHGGLFPMQVRASNGGTADYVGLRTISPNQATTRGVFDVFLVMSNELSSPRLLICPAENEARLAATTFSGTIPVGSTNAVPLTNDLNTSYFVGVDAIETGSQMLLSGDHNLGSDGNLVPLRGFVTAPATYSPDFKVSLGTNFVPNAGVGWLNTMHVQRGNSVIGDCSVQQLDRVHLQQTLQHSGEQSLSFGPNFPSPPFTIGAGINRVQFP